MAGSTRESLLGHAYRETLWSSVFTREIHRRSHGSGIHVWHPPVDLVRRLNYAELDVEGELASQLDMRSILATYVCIT